MNCFKQLNIIYKVLKGRISFSLPEKFYLYFKISTQIRFNDEQKLILVEQEVIDEAKKVPDASKKFTEALSNFKKQSVTLMDDIQKLQQQVNEQRAKAIAIQVKNANFKKELQFQESLGNNIISMKQFDQNIHELYTEGLDTYAVASKKASDAIAEVYGQ